MSIKKMTKKLDNEEEQQLDDYMKFIKMEPLDDFDLDTRPKARDESPKTTTYKKLKTTDSLSFDFDELPKAKKVKTASEDDDIVDITDDYRPSKLVTLAGLKSLVHNAEMAGLKSLVHNAEKSEWFDLGNDKKVKAYKSPFTGQTLMELKKFNGDTVTDTGITLDEAQIRIMHGLLPALEIAYEAVLHTDENIKISEAIGRNVFVNLNSKVLCVDLRKFFTPRGKTESFPSKKTGIGTQLISSFKI
jgi:hypothetical protein